jgi:hypothetical protein
MVGNSSVRRRSSTNFLLCSNCFSGNYDITKLHYDGPGAVPGAPGSGYGYDVRTNGRFSTLSEPVSA